MLDSLKSDKDHLIGTGSGTSREAGEPSSSTNNIEISSSLNESLSRMECLRGFKFAQILGFGSNQRDDSYPVTMANLDFPSHGGTNIDSSGETNRESESNIISNAAPLEPSFYQVGMRVVDTQWAMNYQEATIYLEEGENNDQFSTHPKRRESLPAYVIAHTKWFYLLDWFASILLLALAVIEPPAMQEVPIAVHSSLELGALTIILFGLVLKLRWLGVKTIFTHHRTLTKALTLFVMFLEAILVLVRQQSHFRVTRALRPIFLVDNRYLRGVRRFSRQVLQSLPPIFDMLLLLFFFIVLFSLLGHFLFGHNPADPFFSTFDDSFVNLFVLLTTANYPDIMMPSYSQNKWSVLFFVAYLVTILYLFMNLLLAVVYDTFTMIEKEKFMKLIVHKRQACDYAFNLLVSKSNTNGIIFRHFYGMMTYFEPNKSLRDIYLTFRALNRTSDGVLTREQFAKFYEVANLRWKPVKSILLQREWTFFKGAGVYAQKFLNSPYSNHFFNTLIVLNSLAMVIRWVEGQTSQESWDSYLFATLFLIEMGLKMVTWGLPKLTSSGWHTFDLITSVAFMFSLIFVRFIPELDEVLTFIRPLRLLRLFKLKKRYRNIFGTVFILIPPMSSVAFVILLLYYFFAIVGMEIFSNVQLRNCCNGSIVEDYYKDSGTGLATTVPLRYYLNSFEDLFTSYVTLFELTVVNNWYVIMEGYRVALNSRYVRIFFITFYLATMCILTIVVAFILDTFLFRMQYKRAMDKKTENRMLRTEVALSADEIDFCYKQYSDEPSQRSRILQDYGEDLAARGYVNYVGWRTRNKEILFKRMFKQEIPIWVSETRRSEGVLPGHIN